MPDITRLCQLNRLIRLTEMICILLVVVAAVVRDRLTKVRWLFHCYIFGICSGEWYLGNLVWWYLVGKVWELLD